MHHKRCCKCSDHIPALCSHPRQIWCPRNSSQSNTLHLCHNQPIIHHGWVVRLHTVPLSGCLQCMIARHSPVAHQLQWRWAHSEQGTQQADLHPLVISCSQISSHQHAHQSRNNHRDQQCKEPSPVDCSRTECTK